MDAIATRGRHIERLGNRRLQGFLVPQAVDTTKLVICARWISSMLPCEKNGFLFQGRWPSKRGGLLG